VAGEDQEKIKPLVARMHSFGVKSILDYSVEEDTEGDHAKEEAKKPPVTQSLFRFTCRFCTLLLDLLS
jgi:proline dehydrogenase